MSEMQPVASTGGATAASAGAAQPAPGSYAALRAAARSGAQHPAAQQAQQQAAVAAEKGAATAQHAAEQGAIAMEQAQADAAVAAEHARQQAQIAAQHAQRAAEQARDELGDPALRSAAQQSLEATRARAAHMQERGSIAAEKAQAQAQDAAMRAQASAHVAAGQAGQMAVAAADVARSQFEQRWSDVVEQERQLAEQASRLEKYERQLNAHFRNDAPNFPGKCCCIDPIVFHDITADVFPARQKFVKSAYTNWYLTILFLVYNAAIAITMMFIDNKENKEGPEELESHLAIAVVMLLGIPLSFVLWYWPIYKACSTGASGQHIMSYIGIVVAIVFNIIVAVGPVGFGGCGALYGFAIKDAKGNDAFYPCLINAFFFAVQCAYFMFLFYRMKCVYGPEDKASMATAHAEMTRDSVLSSFR